MLDLPPGGASTLLLFFAEGSRPEYITVELAAIEKLFSSFSNSERAVAQAQKGCRGVFSDSVFQQPGPIKVQGLLLVPPVLARVT